MTGKLFSCFIKGGADFLLLDLFEPRNLRGRTTYPDLSGHSFSEEEKRAFMALAEATEQNCGASFAALCRRYLISRTTASSWKRRASFDLPIHSAAGRPSLWSHKDQSGIRQDIIDLRKDHLTPNRKGLRQLLQARADHTSHVNHTGNRPVSKSSVKRIKEKLQIVPRKVQVISFAREHSGSDPRMVYSMVLLANATIKNAPAPHIWNWDFTQYIVGNRGDSSTGYIVVDDENHDPVSVVGDSTLPFAIKWAHMGSAAGESVPLVLMVAINELQPDDWMAAELFGLVAPTCKSRKGYLYFGKDRSGTPDFWRWFLETVALDTIVDCRKDYNLRDALGMLSEATVTCDGEQIVMNEIFTNELMELFTDHEVTVGKLPASCSGILQPADRAKTFLASKKRLRSIVEEDLDVSNPVLEANIMQTFKQLEHDYNIDVPSGKKRCIIYGCLAVMRAICDSVKPHVISDGFRVTGQYPFSISQMLDQSYADIDVELRDVMNSRLENDLPLFREQGYLTEAQYAASGIPTNDDPTGKPRDERGLHNQRAMLLTHPKTVERRQLKLSNGLDLDNIMTAQDLSKKDLKDLEAATRLIANDEKGKSKKRTEKDRRESLTEQEKEAERDQKRQKTHNNATNKADKLVKAHSLVENAQKGNTVL